MYGAGAEAHGLVGVRAARLKSCPDASCFPGTFWPQGLKPEADFAEADGLAEAMPLLQDTGLG